MQSTAKRRFERFEVTFDRNGRAQSCHFLPAEGSMIQNSFASSAGCYGYVYTVAFPDRGVHYNAAQIKAALHVSRLHGGDRVLMNKALKVMEKKPSLFQRMRHCLRFKRS